MPNFDLAYPAGAYVIVDPRPAASVQLELSDGECGFGAAVLLCVFW